VVHGDVTVDQVRAAVDDVPLAADGPQHQVTDGNS
jgi:hypothetical protein